jgi:hypothetical protein
MKFLCLRFNPRRIACVPLDGQVRASGAQPAATLTVIGPPFEIFRSALYDSDINCSGLLAVISTLQEKGTLEAVLCDNPWSGLPGSFEHAIVISSDEELRTWTGESLAIIRQEPLVTEVAGALFRNVVTARPEFRTTNPHLFDSLFLPVELARYGSGVFFQERIANRLRQIGLIETDDEVLLIEDLGGWNSIAELTASVAVNVTRHGEQRREVLLAHALIPAPPIRPEGLSTAVDGRRRALASLGIRTSVLTCIPGVIYERAVQHSLTTFLREAGANLPRTVVLEAAQFLGLQDAGVFEGGVFADCDRNDYVEFASPKDVNAIQRPNLFSCLRTDMESVFWSDLGRPLSLHKGTNGREIESFVSQLDNRFHEDARGAYLSALRDGRHLVNGCDAHLQ